MMMRKLSLSPEALRTAITVGTLAAHRRVVERRWATICTEQDLWPLAPAEAQRLVLLLVADDARKRAHWKVVEDERHAVSAAVAAASPLLGVA